MHPKKKFAIVYTAIILVVLLFAGRLAYTGFIDFIRDDASWYGESK